MIKLIIFDLDGVLVESRELHYVALNKALAEFGEQYVISREEHLCKYDALTTTMKLDRLTNEKGLPKEYHHKVWQLKQKKTLEEIDNFQIDQRIQSILKSLKDQDYIVACATNSIAQHQNSCLYERVYGVYRFSLFK